MELTSFCQLVMSQRSAALSVSGDAGVMLLMLMSVMTGPQKYGRYNDVKYTILHNNDYVTGLYICYAIYFIIILEVFSNLQKLAGKQYVVSCGWQQPLTSWVCWSLDCTVFSHLVSPLAISCSDVLPACSRGAAGPAVGPRCVAREAMWVCVHVMTNKTA